MVKKAYLENIAQNSNWAKTIQVLNVALGLHMNPLVGNKLIDTAKTNMAANYTRYWRAQIGKSSRLDFYSSIKNDFKEESYLHLPSFRSRQLIAKLRCSNHYLEIEKGRHKNINRDHRICKVCNLKCVEDEWHFLFRCPCYDRIRLDTLGVTNNTLTSNYHNTLQSITNLDLAKYIKEALKLREETLGYYRVSWNSLSGMQMKITKTNKKVPPSKTNPLTNLQATKPKGDLRITISRKERKKRWKSILNPSSLKMVIRCLNPTPK